jgi:lysyl-tRNA synthetase class 2
VPPGLEHDAVLDLAFGTVVLAGFDPAALTFVYDYPPTQAALARLKPTSPPVAARFEAFSGGIELANGFHELNDAAEQRRRFVAERERRAANGQHAPPLDEQLLAALPSLPDCAGVALGFDRLVALAAGLSSVAAAMSFAHGNGG